MACTQQKKECHVLRCCAALLLPPARPASSCPGPSTLQRCTHAPEPVAKMSTVCTSEGGMESTGKPLPMGALTSSDEPAGRG